MSFVIQSPRATNTPTTSKYFLCPYALGTSYIVQQSMPTGDETLPPLDPSIINAYARWYMVPADPNDIQVFGLYTQYSGRTYWMMMDPSFSDASMRYWVGSFPPTGPHPTKFKVVTTPYYNSPDMTIYSTYYAKYFQANTATTGFSCVTTPDAMCKFKIISLTSTGPVIPTPADRSTSPKAQYQILTYYGLLLRTSNTAPYLSQTYLNFNSTAQRFYFRAQKRPTVTQPVTPFTYNMYMVDYPDTMLCIDDTDTLDIRTEAGEWEEFIIKPVTSPVYPEWYGRFMIVGYSFMSRLRCNADGSVSVVPLSVPEAPCDYFCFMMNENGIPFGESDAIQNDSKLTASSTTEPLPMPQTQHPLKLAVGALARFLLSFLLLPYRTLAFWLHYLLCSAAEDKNTEDCDAPKPHSIA